jgi:tetratricopeptide (TPR) repeat protein
VPISGAADNRRGSGSKKRSPQAGPARRRLLGLAALVGALILVLIGWGWRSTTHRAVPAAPTGSVPTGEEARRREAAARAPQAAAARQSLGKYLLDQGQPFEAAWELWAAKQLQPNDASTTVQLAVALASGQLYDAAIEQLEGLASAQPPTREGRIQLATLYLARLQPEKAVALLRRAPELERWPEGQLTLGQSCEALGQAEPAAAAYGRAARLAPSSPEPIYRLADLALRRGNAKAAATVLMAALERVGAQVRLLTLMAEVEIRRGNTAAAERHLRAALQADAGHMPALVALGRLYHRQKRYKESLSVYRAALQLAPADADANEGMAELLEAAGRAVEARSLRARALRSRGLPHRALSEYEALVGHPEHQVPATLEMGLVLIQMQQKARAVQVTEKALATHSKEPSLYERLVVGLLLVPNLVEAKRRCEEWRRLQPESVRPVWVMGKIAADEGDLERAVPLLERAVAGEPENMDYAVTLADTLLRQGGRSSIEHARELLERAVARPPVEAKTYFSLAQANMRLDQPETGRRAFLRCLDLDPNVSEAYVSLVRLARQLGQPEQLRLWGPLVRTVEGRLRLEMLRSRRVWEHPEDPVGHRDMALFYLENAELRKAESQLEEVLRLRPGWPEAQQLLSRVRRAREVL